MPIPFDQLLLRYLRKMRSFTEVAEGLPLSALLAGQRDGDKVLGWYRAPRSFEHDVVVFTDKALYLGGQQIVRMGWDEIEDSHIHPPTKAEATGVNVRSKSWSQLVPAGEAFLDDRRDREVFALLNVVRWAVVCRDAEKTRAQ